MNHPDGEDRKPEELRDGIYMVTLQDLRVSGQSVAYDVLGEGQPTVLVHGTPFSSHVWRRIGPELACDRQVFLFDLLGYGQSEMREGQDVSLGVQNELFAALLGHWGLEAPDVVAHDFGGATVLRAHLLNGCDYRRLLLFDVVAIRPWGSAFVQHVRNHEAAFAGTPDYLQRAILLAYLRGTVSRPIADSELEPYVAPCWARSDSRPSTGRSPRWTCASPTRCRGAMARSAARCTSSGAKTIPGSPSNGAGNWRR